MPLPRDPVARPDRQRQGPVGDALEASTQRLRDYVPRPYRPVNHQLTHPRQLHRSSDSPVLSIASGRVSVAPLSGGEGRGRLRRGRIMVKRTGSGGGSDPTGRWGSCWHRGRTPRRCASGRRRWSVRPADVDPGVGIDARAGRRALVGVVGGRTRQGGASAHTVPSTPWAGIVARSCGSSAIRVSVPAETAARG